MLSAAICSVQPPLRLQSGDRARAKQLDQESLDKWEGHKGEVGGGVEN